jgi:AAA domain
MGSLFRRSSERKRTVKVLAWGVTNAGKSYLGYSAPKPIALNWENRRPPGPFAGMDFPEFSPSTVSELLEAYKEIAAAKDLGESVILDSLQKPYDAIVAHFTTKGTKDGKNFSTVDYVAVNRMMLTVIAPLCALKDVNVIAIARQAVQLERNGNDFRRAGIKMVGDLSRWEYEFDYVLHYAGRGLIEVQKSMSDHLALGVTIHGDLDWDRLMRLVSGEEKLSERVQPAEFQRQERERQQRERAQAQQTQAQQPSPPADPARDPMEQDTGHRGRVTEQLETIFAKFSDAQRTEIGALAREHKITPSRLLLVARSVSTEPIAPAKFALFRDVLVKQAQAAPSEVA